LSGEGQNASNKKARDGLTDPDSSEERGYTFNGKVVIGIGVIMIAAAASTILAMSSSQSPQIHLSSSEVLGTRALVTAPIVASAQVPPNTNQHIDKRFVLVQHDFGWNGTFGGPTIRVSKGDVVQITIINAGMMAHNFGIAELSNKTLELLQKTMNMPLSDRVRYLPYNVMAAMPCPDCQPKFQEGHIDVFMQPDTQQVTTFTATQAGHFKYFCQVRGHLWLGMVGDLDVIDTSNPTTLQTPVGQRGAT
jgi:FtsP/CotA-like multicopper oxidase with cupredoxin domain